MSTTSKSRRARTIALGRRGKSEAGKWWFKQRAAWDRRPDAPFFCTSREKLIRQTSLTTLFLRHGKLAGVLPCGPHRFRHTFAVESLKAGMSPSVLMATLGHTSFAMTQRYIKLAEADVKDAKRAASWLDSVKL